MSAFGLMLIETMDGNAAKLFMIGQATVPVLYEHGEFDPNGTAGWDILHRSSWRLRVGRAEASGHVPFGTT